MNIAFQLQRLKFGGGQRVIIALMEELSNRGHSITCITYNKEVADSSLPFNIVYYNRYSENSIFVKFHKQCNELRDILRINKIDICLVFGPELVLTRVCKQLNVKIVISIRNGLEHFDSIKRKILLFIALLTNNRVVLQTNKIQQSLSTYSRKKSVVIPNPIIDNLPKIKANRVKKIVAVGRLSSEKGFSTLLKAFYLLRDRANYELYIYGEGELKEELIVQSKDLLIDKIVHFEGRKEDIVNIISDAEIFVLSSFSEGMPNVLIEAMSMGLACITTDFPSGAANDLITNLENGIIIPVGNENILADAMQSLINNKELRNKLKANSPKIRTTLSKKLIVTIWENMFNELIENKKLE